MSLCTNLVIRRTTQYICNATDFCLLMCRVTLMFLKQPFVQLTLFIDKITSAHQRTDRHYKLSNNQILCIRQTLQKRWKQNYRSTKGNKNVDQVNDCYNGLCFVDKLNKEIFIVSHTWPKAFLSQNKSKRKGGSVIASAILVSL